MTAARLAAAVALAAAPSAASVGSASAPAQHECAIVRPLDGSPFVSDAAECAVKTAPASTFKVPHALIALEAGVVTDPHAAVPWDGTRYGRPLWEKPHSLDSAMKSSVVWFYQRTARSIGRERMLAWLTRLGYGSDSYEGDQASFWLNGDLVVSPVEQLDFVARLVQHKLPAARQHVDAVTAAFTMPAGAITNATGTHPFVLDWPAPLVVRAKTGNTTVGSERVSWVIGHVQSRGRGAVFVARVRAARDLSPQAGAELALRTLNARRGQQ